MKTSIEQISPELAVQYLLSNTNNRPLRKTHVAWLADQMKNQQWKLTHQGICFTQDGVLSDGQHRLEAIIASGMTVPMMVTRGAETGNFEAYDLGIGRTAADITQMPKKKVEILNTLALVDKNLFMAGRFIPADIVRFNGFFGVLIDRLFKYAGTSKKGTSKATVRSAAVLCMAEGNEYALEQYRCLTLLDFSGMSSAVQSLARQLLGTPSKGSNLQREQEFVRALHAFNPDNKAITRLQISDPTAHLKSAQQRIHAIVTLAARKETEA